MMLKAVKKKRAFEDIVKQIRNLIDKERLNRGDKLPTERELMKTFKVSRATVREAIFSLERMKLAERRQGSGTYVIASGEEAFIQSLATSLFHEKDDIIEIYSFRKIIEPEIARLASQNRTLEEMNELEEILKVQEREVASGLNSIQTNSDFHRFLARMAKNRVLERFLLALFNLLRMSQDKYFQTEERKQKSLQGHHAILGPMRSGNGPAARQAMRRHLEDVEDMLFKKKKKVVRDFRSRWKPSSNIRD